jgi:hypothetical protein
LNDFRVVSYSVNDADRIDWVNEEWDRFALSNDAPGLLASAVIGSTLWSHISDLTLRHLLQKIFARARSSRQPLVLTCRCDAPMVRRELDVCIESRDGRSIHVASTVTAEMPRRIPYTLGGRLGLIRMCSWCNAVDVGGQWVDLEVAVGELGLLKGPHHPEITHTLCLRCEQILRAESDL